MGKKNVPTLCHKNVAHDQLTLCDTIFQFFVISYGGVNGFSHNVPAILLFLLHSGITDLKEWLLFLYGWKINYKYYLPNVFRI